MPEGRVKWYNEKKGYGFIVTEKEEEIFVHSSGISDHGYFGLQSDDSVSFEIRETAKGKQAVNVKPVKSS